jgi:hypothetical protein
VTTAQTTTSTVLTTTTLTPVVPTCTNGFKLQAQNGPQIGRYAHLYDIGSGLPIVWTLSLYNGFSNGNTFFIDPTTDFFHGSDQDTSSDQYAAIGSTSTFSAVTFYSLSCLSTPHTPATAYYKCYIGARSLISCEGDSVGATVLQQCSSLGPDYAADVAIGTALGDGCTPLQLQAICVDAVPAAP